MSPVTHLLLGWTIGGIPGVSPRDRRLITLASVAPDIDGLGAVVDLATRGFGLSPTFFYATYHHHLFHGLFGALVCLAILVGRATHRLRTTVLGLLAFHLHLLCDLLGSRGPDAGDIWPIHYLGPFSRELSFSWTHQWPLNAWPNLVISGLLLMFTASAALKSGVSPISLLSERLDRVFVATLRNWYGRCVGRA